MLRTHAAATLAVLLALGPVPAWSGDMPAQGGLSRVDLPTSLPLRRDGGGGREGSGWTGPLIALSLAGGAGGWAAWRRISRRRSGASGALAGRAVVRVSSHALTPHASLHAVRWNGEELLLACTAQHVSVISRRPDDAAPEAKE